MALLHPDGRTVASVRVANFCDGFFLTLEAFNRLVGMYPSFRE